MGRAKFAVGKEPEVVVGPLTGYRNWTISRNGRYLRSWYNDEVIWRPRVPHVAQCCHSRWWKHDPPPDIRCTCGIYAHKFAKDVEVDVETFACGRVALWGKILEYDRGYRAEFAYPTFVVIVGERVSLRRVRDMEEAYGVPFEVLDSSAASDDLDVDFSDLFGRIISILEGGGT